MAAMATREPTESPERERRLARRCAGAGVALVFAVIVSSAYLRLAQAGLGCADWPACYGAARELTAGAQPGAVAVMRATHRIAAAAVGFVVIAIGVLCLGAARQHFKQARVVGLLLALTIFLAVLGRATPGAHIPAVTLGNLLGGMVLLGAMWWLRLTLGAAPRAPNPVRSSYSTGLGVALVAAPIALGALVTANYAGASCATIPDCHGAWWPPHGTFAMLDPWNAAGHLSGANTIADPARRVVHMIHRLSAFIAIAYWTTIALIAASRRRPGARWAALTVALLGIELAVGAAHVMLGLPLTLGVAHNALAALLVLTAVSALHWRSAEAADVSAACHIVTSK